MLPRWRQSNIMSSTHEQIEHIEHTPSGQHRVNAAIALANFTPKAGPRSDITGGRLPAHSARAGSSQMHHSNVAMNTLWNNARVRYRLGATLIDRSHALGVKAR